MRRIRTIVLLETLLIVFVTSSAWAVPVRATDGNFSEFVPTLVSSEGTWTWGDAPEANQVLWSGEPGGSLPGGADIDGGPGQPDKGGIQNFLIGGPVSWNDFNGVQGSSVRYSAPEPGTFLLFGAALAGAGLTGWRRRRRGRALGRTEP